MVLEASRRLLTGNTNQWAADLNLVVDFEADAEPTSSENVSSSSTCNLRTTNMSERCYSE